jgi:hypothetical protein
MMDREDWLEFLKLLGSRSEAELWTLWDDTLGRREQLSDQDTLNDCRQMVRHIEDELLARFTAREDLIIGDKMRLAYDWSRKFTSLRVKAATYNCAQALPSRILRGDV